LNPASCGANTIAPLLQGGANAIEPPNLLVLIIEPALNIAPSNLLALIIELAQNIAPTTLLALSIEQSQILPQQQAKSSFC
jgi:hypothetical protein